ncbi:MAG: sulfurtransferase TusA family protein [Rhodospirillales bacterium]|nr:sulfurtransferase TusA family protein [Rhodospirillales bacterium]
MEQKLDTKGLTCPLPVLRTKKAMKDVPAGGRLTVEATDPGAIKDFEAFCQATGNELVSSTSANGVLTFIIRKTA